MNEADHEKMTEVATLLGATYIKARYGMDESKATHGIIAFGDASDWRTLMFLVYKPWNEAKVTISYEASYPIHTGKNGLTRLKDYVFKHTPQAVCVTPSRPAKALASDILRRLVTPAKSVHPDNVEGVEKAMWDYEKRAENLKRLGLSPDQGKGSIWNRKSGNYAWASVTYGGHTSANVSINGLTYDETMKLKEFLEGLDEC